MKPRKLWTLALFLTTSCKQLPPGAYVPPPADLLAECGPLLPLPDAATCGDLARDLLETETRYEICAARHQSLAKAVSE